MARNLSTQSVFLIEEYWAPLWEKPWDFLWCFIFIISLASLHHQNSRKWRLIATNRPTSVSYSWINSDLSLETMNNSLVRYNYHTSSITCCIKNQTDKLVDDSYDVACAKSYTNQRQPYFIIDTIRLSRERVNCQVELMMHVVLDLWEWSSVFTEQKSDK